MRVIYLLALICLLILPSSAAGQSRCADCHFANMNPSFAEHVSAWDRSAHAAAAIGCERCHGGDPTTFEAAQAHRDIIPPLHRASPVSRLNLPATCGKCHTGPYVAFQKSRHYALLRGGNLDAPGCTTCHGEVAAELLSPKGLEGECAACHGAGRKHERIDYPPQGRLMQQGIRDVRAQLREARSLIRRVKDPVRRAELEYAAQQVEVPLVEAANAGHQFVFDDLEERVDTARSRVTALLDRLAVGPTR